MISASTRMTRPSRERQNEKRRGREKVVLEATWMTAAATTQEPLVQEELANTGVPRQESAGVGVGVGVGVGEGESSGVGLERNMRWGSEKTSSKGLRG